MSPESPPRIDLLDLKLLPAWLKEPSGGKRFEHYSGEEEGERPRGRGKRPTPKGFASRQPSVGRPLRKGAGGRKERRRDRPHRGRKEDHRNREAVTPVAPPPDVAIRFLPRSPVLDSVVEQIKSGAVAYSLFHLARLFLEKPERYEVRLTAKPDSPLYQLGENGAISVNRQFLEENAFRFAHHDFYKIEITEGEPIKGNFSSVACDRLSGTLLGPTNYHTYQPRLRTLYEQRFSRRMSFSEYQRQIEIVNDPELIERWKKETQRVTTYTTLREEIPATFSSTAETERHFKANYLPGFVRGIEEVSIGGVASRHLSDRPLHRAIEEAWVSENRSPSNLMQELAGRFRQAGLHVFRHRRGMLFVSPLRPQPFIHEQTGVSELVNAILKTLSENPGIPRKDLAEKLIVRHGESVQGRIDLTPEEAEPRKMALASDLHWLISAGHVIEFNDGSLDLPRAKATQGTTASQPSQSPPPAESIETTEPAIDITAATPAD